MRIDRFFRPASSEEIAAVFARQRAQDPQGLHAHELCAMLGCLAAGGPTSIAEWAIWPAFICLVVRLTNPANRLVTRPLLRDRVAQLLACFVLFAFASIWWSACWRTPIGAVAHRDWLRDVQSFRFALIIPALYPVLEKRLWLIGALILGLFFGQLSQVVHLAGVALHLDLLNFHRMPGRISGWWDPVIGGSVLCAALGLQAAIAVSGINARIRFLAGVLSCFTFACVLATGTRGAWLGAAGVVAFAVVYAVVKRRPSMREVVRRGVPVLVAALLVLGGVWLLAGKGISARFSRGWQEVARGIEKRDYTTDTGMRLAMWRWAGMEWVHSPLVGVGAGGFRPFADEQIARRSALHEPEPLPPPHAHAHSWYFHTLATTGVIGFVLLFGAVGLAIWSGLGEVGLGLGPAFGLVGLLGAGVFDTIHINQQTALMLWILMALCVPSRPKSLLRPPEPMA